MGDLVPQSSLGDDLAQRLFWSLSAINAPLFNYQHWMVQRTNLFILNSFTRCQDGLLFHHSNPSQPLSYPVLRVSHVPTPDGKTFQDGRPRAKLGDVLNTPPQTASLVSAERRDSHSR